MVAVNEWFDTTLFFRSVINNGLTVGERGIALNPRPYGRAGDACLCRPKCAISIETVQ